MGLFGRCIGNTSAEYIRFNRTCAIDSVLHSNTVSYCNSIYCIPIDFIRPRVIKIKKVATIVILSVFYYFILEQFTFIDTMNNKLKVFLYGKNNEINWRKSDIYVNFGLVVSIWCFAWGVLWYTRALLALWQLFETIMPETIYQPIATKLQGMPNAKVPVIISCYIVTLIILAFCDIIRMQIKIRLILYLLLMLLMIFYAHTCFSYWHKKYYCCISLLRSTVNRGVNVCPFCTGRNVPRIFRRIMINARKQITPGINDKTHSGLSLVSRSDCCYTKWGLNIFAVLEKFVSV